MDWSWTAANTSIQEEQRELLVMLTVLLPKP